MERKFELEDPKLDLEYEYKELRLPEVFLSIVKQTMNNLDTAPPSVQAFIEFIKKIQEEGWEYCALTFVPDFIGEIRTYKRKK